jgi:hypothetical protein
MDASIDRDTLSLPPLPTLKWDDYSWVTSIMLPSWEGFQSRQGPYNSIDELITSDGSITLMLHTPDNEPSTLSIEQVVAYQHLIEHQEYIRDSLLQAIFAEYPTWQEEYALDFSAEEAEEVMPHIQSPEQLKDLIGLSIVHIHTDAKDGIAYVGYEFGCNWEEEHGLGAMTHAGRVVDIGGADTAILEWIAEQDADKGA